MKEGSDRMSIPEINYTPFLLRRAENYPVNCKISLQENNKYTSIASHLLFIFQIRFVYDR